MKKNHFHSNVRVRRNLPQWQRVRSILCRSCSRTDLVEIVSGDKIGRGTRYTQTQIFEWMHMQTGSKQPGSMASQERQRLH